MFLMHYYFHCYFKEVDIGGICQLSPSRAEDTDPAVTSWTGNLRMISRLGSLKVDPWSFFFSLTPLVWLATMTALLAVILILQIFHLSLPGNFLGHGSWQTKSALSCVRVFLQQGESLGTAQLFLNILTLRFKALTAMRQ